MEHLFVDKFVKKVCKYAISQEVIDARQNKHIAKCKQEVLRAERMRIDNFRQKIYIAMTYVVLPVVFVLGFPLFLPILAVMVSTPFVLFFVVMIAPLWIEKENWFETSCHYTFIALRVYCDIGRAYIRVMGPNPNDLWFLFRIWHYTFQILVV